MMDMFGILHIGFNTYGNADTVDVIKLINAWQLWHWMCWIGLHLFNDDTCPPGHITRPEPLNLCS